MPDLSFEGTDAKRAVASRRDGLCRCGGSRHGGLRSRRLALHHGLQKCRGRYEEQVSSDGAAKVEDPIIVAGRTPNEHILEHLLDDARRTTIADEIRAKFILADLAERHVVAHNLELFPVLGD